MPTYLTTPSKTAGASHVAWQDVTTGNQVIPTAVPVAAKKAITFDVRLGRRSGSAFTAGWPNIRFEGSVDASGSRWVPFVSPIMNIGASIANTTLNGAVSAGATSFVVTSATNIAVGDILYLGDPTSSNWELVRVKGVSGTTITPEEPVVNAHATGAAVTDQAEMYSMTFGTAGYQRMRALVDNAGSGQTVAVEITYALHDSDSTT